MRFNLQIGKIMKNIVPKESIVLFGLAALASCADYGPGDLAAGTACGVVQERCTDACDQRYQHKYGDPSHSACLEACYESKGKACY